MPPKRPKKPPDRGGKVVRRCQGQRSRRGCSTRPAMPMEAIDDGTDGDGGHLAGGLGVDRFSAAGPSMDALLVEVALNRYNIAEIHGDGQMSTHVSWCAELETPHQPDTPGAVFGRQY